MYFNNNYLMIYINKKMNCMQLYQYLPKYQIHFFCLNNHQINDLETYINIWLIVF